MSQSSCEPKGISGAKWLTRMKNAEKWFPRQPQDHIKQDKLIPTRSSGVTHSAGSTGPPQADSDKVHLLLNPQVWSNTGLSEYFSMSCFQDISLDHYKLKRALIGF